MQRVRVRECRWHLTHGWSAWNWGQRGGKTFMLTEHSNQWLWGQREAVNLLSSFCCLLLWVLWSQVSVDTWFMSPVSIRWLLLPPSGSQQPKAALMVPDLIVLFIYFAKLTSPYSPQQWPQRYNGLTHTCMHKRVQMYACLQLCHSMCVIFVQQCCVVFLSVSFRSSVLYKLGFYDSHWGPDTNYANY